MRWRSGSPAHTPVRRVARLVSSIRWIKLIPVRYQLLKLIVQVLLRLLPAKMLMIVVVLLFRLVYRNTSVLLLLMVVLLLLIILLLLVRSGGSINLLRGR